MMDAFAISLKVAFVVMTLQFEDGRPLQSSAHMFKGSTCKDVMIVLMQNLQSRTSSKPTMGRGYTVQKKRELKDWTLTCKQLIQGQNI